jgi:hypothetical protein
MRDALLAGRTLAEHVLGVLDDPVAVDRATRAWEAARDRECLPAYHFANSDTRVERPSPTIRELIRDAGRSTEPDIGDLFGRARTPQQVATPARMARALAVALARRERSPRETLARAFEEARVDLRVRAESRAGSFRSTRAIAGSEHPGATWPEAGA